MGIKNLTIINYERILFLQRALSQQHPKDEWSKKMHDPDTRHNLFYALRKRGMFYADGIKEKNGRIIPLYRINTETYRTLIIQCPTIRLGFLYIIETELAKNSFAHFTEPEDFKLKTLREELRMQQ